jgi:hypothetical protein
LGSQTWTWTTLDTRNAAVLERAKQARNTRALSTLISPEQARRSKIAQKCIEKWKNNPKEATIKK